jgi:quinol monooxygenase YgiN
MLILSNLVIAIMMATPELYIATYVEVQPPLSGQSVTLVKQYREATQKEAGNAGIEVVQEVSRSNRFVILEVWKDQASFEMHEKANHTADFRSSVRAIHGSPYDQRVHQGLTIDARSLAIPRNSISVVTHVDVPPPRREEAEALLKTVAEESRKDEGNIRYDVFQESPSRTNHFTVFATWRDAKAFESHEVKPHVRRFREALGPMLGAPYDDRLYKPID